MSDLADYVTRCNDTNSRIFIEEAVNSYKAGAYRSCINNTWLAIAMNITFKIEQLALLSDAEAIVQKERLDRIRSTNDISGMLLFERDLLKLVKEKFELFDDIVLVDLVRIQEDRNRCSHPLLHADDQAYSPTPEQARHHLRIAVDKLLSESNVFGKAALGKILELLNSPIFPIDFLETEKVLSKSYLNSPKKPLVSNLLKVLYKEILNSPLDYRNLVIRKNTIKFVIGRFRNYFETTLADLFASIIDFTNPDHLDRFYHFFQLDAAFWDFLQEDKRILARQYVRGLPSSQMATIDEWLRIPAFSTEAQARLDVATREEMNEILLLDVSKFVTKRIIDLYLESNSFNEANWFSQTVINCIGDIDVVETKRLVVGAGRNSQIRGSRDLSKVLWKIRKAEKIPTTELDQILHDNNLDQYVSERD